MPRMHGEHRTHYGGRQLAKALSLDRVEIKFEPVTLGPMCTCVSFRFAHLPEDHKKLKSDMDWRTYEQRIADAQRVSYREPPIR